MSRIEWIEDRWHCQGRGIHAGDLMELRGYTGEWIPVRIESSDSGRRLSAFVVLEGVEFARGIEPEVDRLRWPRYS